MKNIHVIPTEKPSRVFLNKVNNKLLLEDVSNLSLKNVLPSGSYQNIYITSEEEIKEGEYGLSSLGKVVKFTEDGIYNYSLWKKIILATDPDLIADGVQAIDNEFLECFVRNPKCEEVIVDESPLLNTLLTYLGVGKYKIIIPKEEPKRKIDSCKYFNEEIGCNQIDCKCEKEEANYNMKEEILAEMERLEKEPKQETIEEAAERELEYFHEVSRGFDFDLGFKTGMVNGAAWQEKRMYSEEEMMEAFKQGCKNPSLHESHEEKAGKWFEQFKKQKG